MSFPVLGAAVTIKGNTKVGLSLLLFTVRPMKPGATLMNDFLFNVALVLLSTNAAIQFCAQAFALYANESAIHEIWGNQVICPMSFQCFGSMTDTGMHRTEDDPILCRRNIPFTCLLMVAGFNELLALSTFLADCRV